MSASEATAGMAGQPSASIERSVTPAGGRPAVGQLVVIALVAAVVGAAPFFVGPYGVLLVTLVGVYTLASFGLTVLTGHAGSFNLGYAGLMAIGAYGYIIASSRGVPLVVTVLSLIAVGLVVNAFLGAVGAWLGEFSFAIVTFGVTVVVTAVIVWADEITRGMQGIAVGDTSIVATYYGVWATVAVTAALLVWLLRNWPGRILRGVRDDATAAGMFGVSVPWVRFLAITATGVLPVLAGAFYARAIGYISPPTFTTELSLAFLIIVVIGGLTSLWGALVGSIIWIAVPELTTGLPGYYEIILGLLAIGIFLWQPAGIVAVLTRIRRPRVTSTGSRTSRTSSTTGTPSS